MLAISFNRDQINLQCGKSSKSHVTMISGQIPRKQNFDDCKHIWSQVKEIASIYWPFGNGDCKFIYADENSFVDKMHLPAKTVIVKPDDWTTSGSNSFE